jgi:hypothetical protein
LSWARAGAALADKPFLEATGESVAVAVAAMVVCSRASVYGSYNVCTM